MTTPTPEELAKVDALHESCRHGVSEGLVMICRNCLALGFTEQAREIERLGSLARNLRDELRLWHDPVACHRSDVCTTDALLALPEVTAL